MSIWNDDADLEDFDGPFYDDNRQVGIFIGSLNDSKNVVVGLELDEESHSFSLPAMKGFILDLQEALRDAEKISAQLNNGGCEGDTPFT